MLPSDSVSINTVLTWENLNAYLIQRGERFKSFFSDKQQIDSKHILQNVSGIAKPGQLLAIMGSSGAGKTTLLNALTFRNRGSLQLTGSIKINGKPVWHASELMAHSGYVQQNDLFFGSLRVKEHLKFQAMLRLDKRVSREQKMQRVEEALNDLNLKKCQDTLIGIPEIGIKGISGGEMRRLAFASELVTNPSILFADEPTSGLDSFMALSVVESMKNLAQKSKKTIVCTIHQPSSEIFELFDVVYLMAEGRSAFAGTLTEAYEFFDSNGFRCPINYNPADYYIKTLAIAPSNPDECKQTIRTICDSFERSEKAKQIESEIKETSQVSLTATDSWRNSIQISNMMGNSYKSSVFTQFYWLAWRNVINIIRNPLETQLMFVMTIFMALVFGSIFFQLEVTSKNVQNINSVLFLLLTNSAFSNLFCCVSTYTTELPILIKEYFDNTYRPFVFFLCKIVIELPKFIIIPFIYASIAYWMVYLNNDVYKFLICALVIILEANCAASFCNILILVCVFVSAVTSDINTALATLAPILTPLIIFGGLFLNNSTVPSYLLWLKQISWINYSYEILILNQWDDVKSIPCPPDSTFCFRSGDDVIKYMDMNRDHFWMNFVWIGVIIATLRISAFIVLLLKIKFKH